MTDILTRASHQWATRPDEERFLSLTAMHEHFVRCKGRSAQMHVSNRRLTFAPADGGQDYTGLEIRGERGVAFPNNWAFGQLCQRAGAPASYLKTLPTPLVADCLNYAMHVSQPADDIQLLLRRDENDEIGMLAATGPKYGRIFNSTVTEAVIRMCGDGVTGDWTVPGEFGKAVVINKSNTTLYASDRDMFVFLADEKNRIEIPDRRNGQPGSLARGFFVWNSEVGNATCGIAMFLFDYVCQNRIVWGVQEFTEKKIRHTASAPDRWRENMVPLLHHYRNASAAPVLEHIRDARAHKLGDPEAVTEFLSKRFGAQRAPLIMAAHEIDEDRPIETRWDAITGATAFARSMSYTADRVDLERQAGLLM